MATVVGIGVAVATLWVLSALGVMVGAGPPQGPEFVLLSVVAFLVGFLARRAVNRAVRRRNP